MQWDSSWNQPIALAIVFALMPIVRRGHRAAHEETKRRMPEGWLKWLLTHEFGRRRRSDDAQQVGIAGQQVVKRVARPHRGARGRVDGA